MSQRMLAIIALLAFVVLVMGVLLTGGKLGLADAALAHFLPDRHRHDRRRLFSGRPGHGRPDQPSPGRGPLRYRHGLRSGRRGAVGAHQPGRRRQYPDRQWRAGGFRFCRRRCACRRRGGPKTLPPQSLASSGDRGAVSGSRPSGGGGQFRHPDGGGLARQARAAGAGQYQRR